MDIIEGQMVPLKVAGFPVGEARVVVKNDELWVTWEKGEGRLPLPVFDYEAEQ